MEKVRRFWPYLLGTLFIGQYALAFALGWLGNLDTGCVIAEQKPEDCGSVAVIGFLLEPPAWFLSLSFLIGLGLIAYGERKERDKFFVRLKRFIELEGRVAVLENTLTEDDRRSRQDIAAFSDRLDAFSARFTALQEGFDEQTAAAHATVSARASELGEQKAEAWKSRYLELQDVALRNIVKQVWDQQFDAGHYLKRFNELEHNLDAIEKEMQKLAEQIRRL